MAQRPVLVKGKRIWYEDPSAPGGVNSLEHVGTGIPIEWFPYIWGMDHNVLAKEEAWGYSPPNQPKHPPGSCICSPWPGGALRADQRYHGLIRHRCR